MNMTNRNRLNVASRWDKIQQKEKEYLMLNGSKYMYLKARLFGFIAGDGNITLDDKLRNRHNTIKFFHDHHSLLQPFSEALLKVYNKVPHIKKFDKYYYLTADSKVAVQDMVNTAEFGVKKWRVPYKILIDKECKKEWLRAFFDCEAYVGKNHIKVQCINEIGIVQVAALLKEFNIESNKYEYQPKNKNWNKNHILIIGKKDMKKNFLEFIGFNHELKLLKLKNTLNIYK